MEKRDGWRALRGVITAMMPSSYHSLCASGWTLSVCSTLLLLAACLPPWSAVGEDTPLDGACLRLRGGGKFPLSRMMKIAVDRLPAEERARMFDQLHSQVPGLDAGEDRYTRELQAFRRKWAAEEAEALRESEAVDKIRAQRRAGRAARLADKRRTAKLPPLAGDARAVVHALEPYARGDIGAVAPHDCAQALLRLNRVMAGDHGSSAAVRRACTRVAASLLHQLAAAIASCPERDLHTLAQALPIADDRLWHSRVASVQGHEPSPSVAALPPRRGWDHAEPHAHAGVEAEVKAVCAVFSRLAARPQMTALNSGALEALARAAALGALYNCSDSSDAGGGEVVGALKTLGLEALRMPATALSLSTVDAMLLLCCTCLRQDARGPGREGEGGHTQSRSQAVAGSQACLAPPGAPLPPGLLLHLVSAAAAHVQKQRGALVAAGREQTCAQMLRSLARIVEGAPVRCGNAVGGGCLGGSDAGLGRDVPHAVGELLVLLRSGAGGGDGEVVRAVHGLSQAADACGWAHGERESVRGDG